MQEEREQTGYEVLLGRKTYNMAQKYDFTIEDAATDILRQQLVDAVEHKDKDFGNARFVRNVFEKTLEAQAVRLGESNTTSRDELSLLTASDIINGFSH